MFCLIIFSLGMSLCEAITSCECTIDYHFAICPHIVAWPEFVKVIRVECQISDIVFKPEDELDQVLIHGACRDLTPYHMSDRLRKV
jgi:hypothetical protein